MTLVVCQGQVSPDGESLLALPKSNQKASPCTPLHPAVLATGGMRIATIGAIRSKVCADDASTTARCCAPRRGLKGRLAWLQLCGESLVAFGLNHEKRSLSTLGVLRDLAHIKWALQGKAARSPDARQPGFRGIHSNGIKFDFTMLTNPDASNRATFARDFAS